jgi:hypothetical protein
MPPALAFVQNLLRQVCSSLGCELGVGDDGPEQVSGRTRGQTVLAMATPLRGGLLSVAVAAMDLVRSAGRQVTGTVKSLKMRCPTQHCTAS